jgi:hypothetical protein
MTQPSGFSDFVATLRHYRSLLIWSTTAAVLLPTAASRVDLTPPWPPGIVLTSALLQLIVAVVTFQLLGRASRSVISRFLAATACALVIFSSAYLVAVSQLTFIGGPAKERLVKGLTCSADALRLPDFAKDCPLLTEDLIGRAEHVDQLWTTTSVTEARIILVGLWYLALATFSACLVAFIVFQSQQRGRFAVRPNRTARAKRSHR